MKTYKNYPYLLLLIIVISAFLKLYIAFSMPNKLYVGSDDLGYIGSAKMLLETGTLSFHQKFVPTVWITPAYPLFLAPFYWLFSDEMAPHMIRAAQTILSSLAIWVAFLLGRKVKNLLTGWMAALILAFYPPNLLTPNLILTETLFTLLLLWFVYLALDPPKTVKTFVWLGVVWAVTSLVRPTIAMIPALFFLYYLAKRKMNIRECVKYGSIMLVTGVLIFSPWWVRNYIHYDKFIPFTYAEGAPLLEGSFLNGEVDRSLFIESNLDKIYVNEYYKNLGLQRIKQGFHDDFWAYFTWYAVEKPMRLLFAPFYWIFIGFNYYKVAVFHNALNIIALIGIVMAAAKRNWEIAFLALPVVYFTVLYSMYFAFSRYGYPQFMLVCIIAAYAVAEVIGTLRARRKRRALNTF